MLKSKLNKKQNNDNIINSSLFVESWFMTALKRMSERIVIAVCEKIYVYDTKRIKNLKILRLQSDDYLL